jgi:CHC2 zinc finger/Toprim domain
VAQRAPRHGRFWQALEQCLKRALHTKKRVELGNLTAEVSDGNLYLTLPSGRRLAYPQARRVQGRFPDTSQIIFLDNSTGWHECRGWHGTFTENVVQAVARDLLAAAMVRLEAAGYPIVLHVHDEIVCEVAGGADNFLSLMTVLPDWAAGLPIAAKAWERTCYAKVPPLSCEESALNRVGSSLVRLNEAPATQVPAKIVPLRALIGEPLANGKICCPFHDDKTPSLHIYDDHFHCFGCGARGDHADWLMMINGKNRAQAERILKTWTGPIALPPRPADNERTLALAHLIFEKSRPILGTIAMRYLADVRGIDTDSLPTDNVTLRFHPRCPFGPGVRVPCLIALYRDVKTDVPAGIHRIALTEDVLCAGAKVQRRTLGCWPAPRAIKMWPATDQLFLGEGIETVLAAATRLAYCGAPMRPAWAAGSALNISKFPVLPSVNDLVLLVDHDPAGERSSAACRLAWRAAGRKVTRLQTLRFGTDFNNLVLERCAS